jgi:hypothetical protein
VPPPGPFLDSNSLIAGWIPGRAISTVSSLRPNLEASITMCPCRHVPTDGDQMTEAKSDAASCEKYHQDHKTSHWASLLKRPQTLTVMIGSAKSGRPSIAALAALLDRRTWH